MAKNRAVAERAVAFRLNHYCNMPEARGEPGEVIQVPPEVAQLLLERKGGQVVEQPATEEPDGDSPAGE